MSIDWPRVLDELEESIRNGDEFVAPTGQVPHEYLQRLVELAGNCAQRIVWTEAELQTTADELSRLVVARGNSWSVGGAPDAVTFNQSL